MRRLRIAPPVQLQLFPPLASAPHELWARLPEAVQGHVLALLARLIARGVVDAEAEEASWPT